jgi:uncharacterized membrane protein YjdF
MRKISKNTLLNFIILSIFTIIFLVKQNYEFIIYAVTIGLLIYVIEKTNKRFGYSRIAKYGFSLWLLVHFLGGLIYVNGIRLYDLVLIPILGEPFNILKYDQVLHFYIYIVLTLFIYSIVMSMADKKANRIVLYIIIILAGSSLGAVNEVIEFFAVVFFDAGATVGGYYNTALDLVFNLLGAIVAVFLAMLFPKKDS